MTQKVSKKKRKRLPVGEFEPPISRCQFRRPAESVVRPYAIDYRGYAEKPKIVKVWRCAFIKQKFTAKKWTCGCHLPGGCNGWGSGAVSQQGGCPYTCSCWTRNTCPRHGTLLIGRSIRCRLRVGIRTEPSGRLSSPLRNRTAMGCFVEAQHNHSIGSPHYELIGRITSHGICLALAKSIHISFTNIRLIDSLLRSVRNFPTFPWFRWWVLGVECPLPCVSWDNSPQRISSLLIEDTPADDSLNNLCRRRGQVVLHDILDNLVQSRPARQNALGPLIG